MVLGLFNMKRGSLRHHKVRKDYGSRILLIVIAYLNLWRLCINFFFLVSLVDISASVYSGPGVKGFGVVVCLSAYL